MAIVVFRGEPACHDIQVEIINGLEFVISREAGVELEGETMSGGKEEDSGDVSNVMLLKDVVSHDTFGCGMEAVLRVWEGGNGINEDGVVIVSCDDFTGRGKIGAEGILGN